MPKKPRLRPLQEIVVELAPDADPEDEIVSGRVLVDGIPRLNPDSRVSATASVTLQEPKTLRGTLKLHGALQAFDVEVVGRVALDAGASVGGFTRELLEQGARRVYAVEVGFGQLLGSLRQDERVVNLERTNIGSLDRTLVPDRLDLVTLDLGYLALAIGVPQLNVLEFAPAADLLALAKPMAELGLGRLPTEESQLEDARMRAWRGIDESGWQPLSWIRSPIEGSRGAIEMWIHARRR
jgi:23S rRNA (cytidine1920-2'-O)/16S rRNA (cytidine1409-2'-O)-methyltransferase